MNTEAIHLADDWSEDVKKRILASRRGERLLVTPEAIQHVGREIADRFSPDKVILFGSYADGNPTPDSDVDFLVIMRFDDSPASQATAIRNHVTRHGTPFPMDILVRTPEWIAYRAANEDWFIREILERGKVVYEAAHA